MIKSEIVTDGLNCHSAPQIGLEPVRFKRQIFRGYETFSSLKLNTTVNLAVLKSQPKINLVLPNPDFP